MSLRKKTILLVLTTLLGLVAVLYVFLSSVIIDEFRELERETTTRNVNRVTEAVNADIEKLDLTAIDWAKWDDTHEFIIDRNQDYIDTNLVPQTMNDLEINLFAFIDLDGEIVYGHGYDLENQIQTDIPQSILDKLTRNNKLLTHTDTDSSTTGMLHVPEGTMIISSRPILTSGGEGPINGTLIMGRYINDSVVEGLGDQTKLDLTYHPVDDESLPSDFEESLKYLSKDDNIYLKVVDEDNIAGYTMFNDIYGVPALLFKINVVREVYKEGLQTLQYLLASLGIVGFSFIVLILILLERMVLNPILRLSRDVRGIGSTGNLAVRVLSRGKDEIASLGGMINWMLDKLQDADEALRAEKASVERKVEERTKELRVAKEQIEQLYEHDKEVQKLKDQFVTIASHELRTPLTGIKGYASMLFQEKLSKDSEDAVTGMLSGINRLEKLAEELISIASIEKGELKPTFIPTNAGSLIKNALESEQTIAEKKGLKLNVKIAEDLDKIPLDSRLFRNAVANLISNAVKFTEKGTVGIEAKKSAKELMVSVSDSGPGIPKDKQSLLFQKFSKIYEYSTDAFSEGHGLGLYLTKLAVDAHKGKIDLESSAKGSTFTIRIPLTQS